MSVKKVENIVKPPEYHYVGDGFRVHNFIPGDSQLSMKRMNPFILLDYGAKFYFPPADKPRGVGVHPHRGFETVTIAYKGKVEHHDSTGAGGIIEEGDVQWMTASSGILHKEYHEKNWSKHGGDMHMVQLWVNLPSKDKMSAPKYQAITNEMMSKYKLPDDGGEVEVISGNYKSAKGPVSTFTPIHMMNAKLNIGGKAEFTFPANYNTGLLIIEGEVKVNNTSSAPVNNFVLLANDGETFIIEAQENSIVLVLSAEPINEPIAAQGPFVMNTREELIKAYTDYSTGKFGHLED
jgi:quercetin 2,3-dioxygenase